MLHLKYMFSGGKEEDVAFKHVCTMEKLTPEPVSHISLTLQQANFTYQSRHFQIHINSDTGACIIR